MGEDSGSARSRKVIVAGTIGNVLEWYDFAIYGYFAVSIGRHFFPREDAVAQLFATFGVFAVGYLARPAGGVIVGHIGDRYGRRAALTFSVAAMAIPTCLIGILPGYATAGIYAPIALTALRVVQGLSVGGEYPCSMVFLVEGAGQGRRGLMGAFACLGGVCGILFGSAAGAALAAMMSTETLEAWGWRIPFLAGLLVGLAGLWVRRHVLETAPAAPAGRAPLAETLREHGWLVGRFAALTVFTVIPFHVMFIYIVSWLQIADGIPPASALEINTISMIVLVPVMIAAGWASDRYGRKPFLLIATLLGFFGAVPLFWVMLQPGLALAGQLGFVLIIGLYIAVHPALLVETAPPQVRCTAVALGYNLCVAVFGGLTPLTAAWLVERTENELSPGLLIMAASAIAFAALLRFPESYRVRLDGVAVRA
jgi:MHS family proline/betaine transporter-like MFS transporter